MRHDLLHVIAVVVAGTQKQAIKQFFIGIFEIGVFAQVVGDVAQWCILVHHGLVQSLYRKFTRTAAWGFVGAFGFGHFGVFRLMGLREGLSGCLKTAYSLKAKSKFAISTATIAASVAFS